jgi:hypothetical protein
MPDGDQKKPFPDFNELMTDAQRDDPRFRRVWIEWLLERKHHRKAVSERAAKLQLKHLAEWPDPIASIEQSIEKGWTGLFECQVNKAKAKKESWKNQALGL